jgi:hypothetical protein
MAIIRHEVDLIQNFYLNQPSTTPNDRYSFDASKWNGTLTIWLEVTIARSTDAGNSISLVGITDSLAYGTTTVGIISVPTVISSANINIANVTTQQYRPGWGGTSSTMDIRAFKLIIQQDTGTDSLYVSEQVYDIGNTEQTLTVTAASTLQPLSAPKYWKYVAANYDSSVSFTADVVWLVSATTGNKTIVVQESSDLYIWATAVTIVNAASGAVTTTRSTSATFTPKDGYYYRLAWTNSSTMTTVSIFNARIILDQGTYTIYTSGTAIASNTSVQGTGQTIESVALSFTVSSTVRIGGMRFGLFKGGSPSDNLYYEIRDSSVTGTLLATSVNVSGTSLTNSFVNTDVDLQSSLVVNSGTTYWVVLKRSGTGDSTNYYNVSVTFSTPSYTTFTISVLNQSTGGTYTPQSGTWIQTYFLGYGTEITKFEEHYSINNTTFSAGTALQGSLVKWDSTLWSGFTNTYAHQVSMAQVDNSIVEADTSGGTQITNSTVNRANRYGISTKLLQDFCDKSFYSTSDSIVNSGASPISWAQSFTAASSNNLVSVVFPLFRTSTASGTLTCKLYAHSGTYGSTGVPTGAALATSNTFSEANVASTTNTTPDLIEFTFPTPYALVSGTHYFIAIETTNTSTSAFVALRVTSNTSAHGGNAAAKASNTLVWTAQSQDLIFYLYSDGPLLTMPTSQNLDSKATTNGGNVYSSRIIVYAVKTVVTTTPKTYFFIVTGDDLPIV